MAGVRCQIIDAMFLRMAAAIIACAVAVMAGPSCPEVKAEPMDDGSRMRIRHNEAQPLVAYLIEIVDYPGNHFAYVQDELFGVGIAAGSEKEIVVPSLMPGAVPDYLKVTAAIYGNGDTCGAADKVKQIVDARRRNLQLTREIIGRVEKARAAGVSTSNLAAQFAEWARTASPNPTKAVISHVAEQLRSRSAEDILGTMRVVEKTLAASKPAL